MSTPQDSPRRRKQKARRTKQLAEWREKNSCTAKPAAEVLSEQLGRAFTRMATHMTVADSRTGAERDLELHEVRKAAKRLRYATEAAEPVLGAATGKLITHTKRVQEVLGEHQDAVVAAPVLREIAIAAASSGENAFTWGVIYGLEDCTGVDEAALGSAWRGLRKRAKKITR